MFELIVLVLGVTASASIGLFVYARNPKHIVNRLYAVLTIAFIFFPIANYLSLKTTDRLFYIRAVIFFSTVAVGSLYYLVFFLNNQGAKLSKIQRFGVFYTILVALLDWTPLIFKGLSQGSSPTPIPNVLAPLFLIHLVVFPAASFVLMLKRAHASKGTQRLQYIYMLMGISPIFFLAPITAFIMPVVFQNASLIGLSPIYALCFVAGVGFAIVKHKLFDIRFFAIRAAAYLTTLFVMTFVLILPVVLIFTHISRIQPNRWQLTLIVLGGVCLLYLFQYIRGVFDRITNKIFFRHYYDPQEVLEKLGDILVRTSNIGLLRSDTADVLRDALKPVLFKYLLVADGPDHNIIRELNSFTILKKIDLIDVEEAEGIDRQLIALLKANGIALMVKLRTTHEDLGYMVVGYRQSGEGYTERDKQLLRVASGEIAIGMQNALRFQEIQNFNLTLQEKIEEATRKLRSTNNKLRKLDETKDDFISMASHQLRTPLTAVKGYVSMVLDGDAGKISGLQRKLLTQSFMSSQRMVYLISDLLNVSRLRTGKFVIEPMSTNIASVIAEEIEQLQETAKDRKLELIYHKPEHFPTYLMDETKLRQVIMNFIDNAIYYTPSGGKITVNLVESPKTIEFTVVDNGIGVPRHEQHHLFSKFFRAHNAKRARPDGTGLGLFMAKKVVIAQGGAIIFKSQEGKGSTFGFTFAKSRLTEAKDAGASGSEASTQ